MFNDQWFYHKTLRKVVTVFGTLFNNITVKRINTLGEEVERFKVPILYGPKEGWFYRMEQNNLNEPNPEQIDLIQPRMAFQMTSLTYDTTRKLSKINNITKVKDEETLLRQFNPVPYNITMELYILSKFADECNQVVEQILPYFTPGMTVQYLPIPEMSLRDDLHIDLTNVSFEDSWTEDLDSKRDINWTLSFNIKANFYGPIKEQGIIREVIVNTHAQIPENEFGEIDGSEENLRKIPRVQRLVLTPDPITAGPTDDYGYTEVFTEYNDGKRYDPVTGTDVDVDE